VSGVGWQRHLLRYAGSYRRGLAAGCGLAVGQALVVVALPWPMKLAVDNVLKGELVPGWAGWLDDIPGAATDAGRLVLLGVVSVLLALVNWGLFVAWRVWCQTLGMRMTSDLAHDTLERVQRRSPAAPSRFRSGDLVQRVVSDTKCIETLVIGVWMTAFQSLVTFALLAVVMLSVSPLIMLIVVGAALPMLIIARAYRGKLQRTATALADAQADVTTATEQMLSTLPEVQSFGAERAELSRFTGDVDRQVSATVRSARTSVQYRTGIGAVTALGTGMIMVVGGFLVLDGSTTVGTLLVLFSYLASLFGPVEGLAYLAQARATARAGALRILGLVGEGDEVPEPKHPIDPPPVGRGAGITFEDVSFGYTPERPVLQDVNLDIAPGETVAVVGPTGAGKSSLVSLVPRFFDPWSGSVRVDGVDVRRFRIRDLRRRVAVVRQDPLLLPVSVRDNIAYGSPWASERQIRHAAEQALAAEFIEALPEGYDTVLGEKGTTLSGGQRQRLAIARAVCRDAPILILDEPTAALDAESEATLLGLITRAAAGRTIVMVAHRLSTVRWADRIVVVHGARIVEEGDHEALLALDGLYARYQQIQAGGPDFEPVKSKLGG
jgi:ATP-binding cassette subfamily B protein/subfamily B ATP-binding cassette protein MsbA